jgi:hypothetical protein
MDKYNIVFGEDTKNPEPSPQTPCDDTPFDEELTRVIKFTPVSTG